MDLFNLNFFGRSREKDTVDLIQEQMSLVYGSVENTKLAVEALTKKDKSLFEDKRNAVNELEDQIDAVTRRIEENLYSGAFLASSRSRILDFAEDVDDIADASKDVVNMGDIMFEIEFDGEFSSLLLKHMQASLECVGYLRECVKNIDNPDRMPALLTNVRKQEHEVDNLARELFHFIHKRYDAKDYIMISKMIEFMDDISDRSEDASDGLNLIMLMNKP